MNLTKFYGFWILCRSLLDDDPDVVCIYIITTFGFNHFCKSNAAYQHSVYHQQLVCYFHELCHISLSSLVRTIRWSSLNRAVSLRLCDGRCRGICSQRGGGKLYLQLVSCIASMGDLRSSVELLKAPYKFLAFIPYLWFDERCFWFV